MPVPHDLLNQIFNAHLKNPPAQAKVIQLAEELANAGYKPPPDDEGRLIIAGFNFYEFGPVLRVNFGGIHIKNCSFEQTDASKSQFHATTFEGQNRYEGAIFPQSFFPSDYHSSGHDKQDESKMSLDSKLEPEMARKKPTAWQRLMLARCPAKLFNLDLIQHYAGVDGICQLTSDRDFFIFRNTEKTRGEFSHFGAKFHLLVHKDFIGQSLALIGPELFELGYFKVAIPARLEACLDRATKMERTIHESKNPDEQMRNKMHQKELRRELPYTIYLEENSEGAPLVDPGTVAASFARIAEKLRSHVPKGQLLESDEECENEYFSFRFSMDLYNNYCRGIDVGVHSNPVGISHPYQKLLKPKAMLQWTYGGQVSFDAQCHFQGFPLYKDNLAQAINLTLQRCLSEFVNAYLFMSAYFFSKDVFKNMTEYPLLLPRHQKSFESECHVGILLTLIEYISKYLDSEKLAKRKLEQTCLRLEILKDSPLTALFRLVERTRLDLYEIEETSLADVGKMLHSFNIVVKQICSGENKEGQESLISRRDKLKRILHFAKDVPAKDRDDILERLKKIIVVNIDKTPELSALLSPLDAECASIMSPDDWGINTKIHDMLEKVVRKLCVANYIPEDKDSIDRMIKIQKIVELINENSALGRNLLGLITIFVAKFLHDQPVLFVEFLQQMAQKGIADAHARLAKIYGVMGGVEQRNVKLFVYAKEHADPVLAKEHMEKARVIFERNGEKIPGELRNGLIVVQNEIQARSLTISIL